MTRPAAFVTVSWSKVIRAGAPVDFPTNNPTRTSSARALPLRRRGELSATAQWHRGQKYWVVKDPISLRYFHLRDEEHAILQSLDGESSLKDVCRKFNLRFAPQRITAGQLRSFLSRMHKDGLVVADAAAQGDEFIKRHRQITSARIKSAATNILAIRFPGVDPEPLLRRTGGLARWLFRPLTAIAVLMLAVAAMVFFVVQYDVFASQTPTLDTFLRTNRFGWLLVSLAVVKVLHELSHALACRRFGGECHEIGLMLLVFTPCLYCNVTDSWRFPGKWDRIAVAAAGMFAEIALASICTFLWWFSQPGLFNTICMNVVIVCSVSTLIVNGNPLLRYDGYFILADLIEIPNLWQKSRTAFYQVLSRICLGIEPPHDPRTPSGQRTTLIAYAAASIAYRAVVLGFILWVVYRFLLVNNLEIIAKLFVAMTLAGLLALPVRSLLHLLRDPLRRTDVRFSRLTVSAIALTVIIAVVLFVPLPSTVSGVATVESEAAVTVYVTQPGRLMYAIPAGATVKPGDVIVRLDNHDIKDDLLRLRGDRRELIHRRENLKTLRLQDSSFAAEIPIVSERIDDLKRRIAQREKDAEELVIRSPSAGVVMSPLHREPDDDDGRRLSEWRGSPLDPENVGSYLVSETALCQIGRPDRFQVTSLIAESDVEFVRRDQTATVVLEQHAGRVLTGKVVELAKVDLKALPPRFAIDEFPGAAQTSGRRTLLSAHYRVRISLEDGNQRQIHGSRGHVRVSVDSRTLGSRMMRGLRSLFRFEIRQGL